MLKNKIIERFQKTLEKESDIDDKNVAEAIRSEELSGDTSDPSTIIFTEKDLKAKTPPSSAVSVSVTDNKKSTLSATITASSETSSTIGTSDEDLQRQQPVSEKKKWIFASVLSFIIACVQAVKMFVARRAFGPPKEKNTIEEKLAKEESDTKKMGFLQLMSILKPYFWPDGGNVYGSPEFYNRIRSILTLAFICGSKFFSVISPLYLATATTNLAAGEAALAYRNITMYAILGLLPSLLTEAQRLTYLEVKRSAYIQLSNRSFSHLLNLSLNWHLKKRVGAVMRSMSRGTEAADAVVSYLFLNLVPTIVECFAVCSLFITRFKNPKLSLLMISVLTFYGFITIRMTQWRKKFREATVRLDNENNEIATDVLVNYETVKSFSREEFETERYKKSVTEFQKNNKSTMISLSALNTTQQFLVKGTTLLALGIACNDVLKGVMPVGDFVAVNVFILQLFAPLNFLGTIYGAIIKALADMSSFNEILTAKLDVVDKNDATPIVVKDADNGCHIKYENVKFSYPEAPEGSGLKGVSFEMKPGTTTAIVGHTGSGKSTLGRLLYRFYDVRDGQILIDNQSIADHTQKSVRSLIGMVPQDTSMFNESILYNIKYGKQDATMEEVEKAAEIAQISDFIKNLPEGWNTPVGERGLKLSGGEKQRLAIARCLLHNPRIVILDEATSALDTKTENSVQVALDGLQDSRTILVVAHRLSTVKNADQIIVLGDGRILEKGSHSELLAVDGEYAKLWKMQSSEQNKSKI